MEIQALSASSQRVNCMDSFSVDFRGSISNYLGTMNAVRVRYVQVLHDYEIIDSFAKDPKKEKVHKLFIQAEELIQQFAYASQQGEKIQEGARNLCQFYNSSSSASESDLFLSCFKQCRKDPSDSEQNAASIAQFKQTAEKVSLLQFPIVPFLTHLMSNISDDQNSLNEREQSLISVKKELFKKATDLLEISEVEKSKFLVPSKCIDKLIDSEEVIAYFKELREFIDGYFLVQIPSDLLSKELQKKKEEAQKKDVESSKTDLLTELTKWSVKLSIMKPLEAPKEEKKVKEKEGLLDWFKVLGSTKPSVRPKELQLEERYLSLIPELEQAKLKIQEFMGDKLAFDRIVKFYDKYLANFYQKDPQDRGLDLLGSEERRRSEALIKEKNERYTLIRNERDEMHSIQEAYIKCVENLEETYIGLRHRVDILLGKEDSYTSFSRGSRSFVQRYLPDAFKSQSKIDWPQHPNSLQFFGNRIPPNLEKFSPKEVVETLILFKDYGGEVEKEEVELKKPD